MGGTISVDKIIALIEAQFKGAAQVRQLEKVLEKIEKNTEQVNKQMRTFDMRLLSLLFGGMALQRAFGGILRSIFDTFLKAEDKTSGLSQATVRLNAAWEFLKFSIMDALNTDFFIAAIDGVVKFLDWLSQLDREWKITFLGLSAGLALIGTGLMIIGQFKLFWDAVFGMGGFLNNVNTINDKTLGSSGVFTKLRKWAAVGLGIKALFDINSYLSGEMGFRKLIDSLGTDLGLIGLVSGKPWLIALGVSMKLIPFGKQISEFGKTMIERGGGRLQEGVEGGSALGFVTGTLTGSLEAASGAAITGFGTILEFADVYAQNVENSAIKTDEYRSSLENLQPAIEDTMAKIDGKEGSLNTSLNNTGVAMDEVSTTKTESFVNASDTRINQMDKEITKIEEYKQQLADWESQRQNYMGSLRNASPVSE